MKIENIAYYKDKLKIENALYITQVVAKELKIKIIRQRDKYFATGKSYRGDKNLLVPLELNLNNLDLAGIDTKKAEELCRMYLSHRFDLLGSGWAKVNYENDVKGFEKYRYDAPNIMVDRRGEFLKDIINKSNIKSSVETWNKLESSYEPIDWQKDFISGYRWKNSQWYRPQMVADRPGGDIKVPWELSRMQHLPRFAILYHMLPDMRHQIKSEFRNQLLDFMATNPVRYGVNYVCTMDIGIRTANVALAYSLFKSQGVMFDEDFEHTLCNFMFEQCNHICNNLEWSKFLTSNHYFADIVGLLWGGSILPKCRLRDSWLYFAADEINNEILKQFHEEGSNAEGSTAYHRLTGEMAVYSLAIMKYLNRHGEHISIYRKALDIINRAGEFTNSIQRPDSMFTQIGDNDSGLFFRLSITGDLVKVRDAKERYGNLSNYIAQDEEMYLDENLNDARPFISAVYGMFENNTLGCAAKEYPLEASVVSQLCGGKENVEINSFAFELLDIKNDLPYVDEYRIYSEGLNLLENLRRIDYPQFGIVVYKGKNLYLCINITDNGQKGNAGHAHNDKMSFELFIGDKCIFEDPGTYVYTSMPEYRNNYRGVNAHNTINVGFEQNEFNGLFSMHNDTKCSVLELGNNIVEAQVEYKDVIHQRRIEVFEDCIKITDRCNKKFKQQFSQHQVARGYGKAEG